MLQNHFKKSNFEDFSFLYENCFKKRRITNQEVLVEQLSLIQSQDNSTQLPPFQTAFHSSEDQDNSISRDLKHLSFLCHWLTEETVLQNQEQLQELFQEEKTDNGSTQDSQDFYCQICKKQYKNKKTFNSHVQTKHNLTRPFSCNICQKSFKRADYLQKHQVSHKQERDFECSQCEQRFKSRTVLDSHVKMTVAIQFKNAQISDLQE